MVVRHDVMHVCILAKQKLYFLVGLSRYVNDKPKYTNRTRERTILDNIINSYENKKTNNSGHVLIIVAGIQGQGRGS